MRPMILTMSAFGSYADCVTIDFGQVQQGVFLITGDTGAGKTTIFDGITYALYGQTSGGRRDGTTMRSQYAPDGTILRKAVITDSRQVADYAEVLNNAEALQHLREYRNFETAVAIAKGLKANAILEATIDQLKIVRESIEDPSKIDNQTLALANQLSMITEQIATGVRYLLNNATSYESHP